MGSLCGVCKTFICVGSVRLLYGVICVGILLYGVICVGSVRLLYGVICVGILLYGVICVVSVRLLYGSYVWCL